MTPIDEHAEGSLERVKLIFLDDDITLMNDFTSASSQYMEV